MAQSTDMNAMIRAAAGRQQRPDVDKTLEALASWLDDDEATEQMTPAARTALSSYAAERARAAAQETT